MILAFISSYIGYNVLQNFCFYSNIFRDNDMAVFRKNQCFIKNGKEAVEVGLYVGYCIRASRDHGSS